MITAAKNLNRLFGKLNFNINQIALRDRWEFNYLHVFESELDGDMQKLLDCLR